MTDDELKARMVRVNEQYPNREATPMTYFDRTMIVLKPTDGQVAVLARMARSTRMDDWTKVANMVDILEALFAEDHDKSWLSDQLLGGDMPLRPGGDAEEPSAAELEAEIAAEPGPSVLGLIRATIMAFGEPEPANRAERRAPKRRAVRG